MDAIHNFMGVSSTAWKLLYEYMMIVRDYGIGIELAFD
jgi:hypothetical protein